MRPELIRQDNSIDRSQKSWTAYSNIYQKLSHGTHDNRYVRQGHIRILRGHHLCLRAALIPVWSQMNVYSEFNRLGSFCESITSVAGQAVGALNNMALQFATSKVKR